MADLNKKKKVPLPSGWVERFTKKHPDKPYYFNEDTGETRWTPPTNEAMEKQKGRKRKARDDDDEPQVDPPVEVKNNDTPAMKLYREKMAQRKAALEAKKSTPKAKANLNQTVTPQKANGNASATTPSVQRRLRRSSIVPNTDVDSASSDGSVASMGSKIKQLVKAADPVPKTPNKTLPNTPTSIKKLPRIPKVKIVRAEVPTSSGSVSDYGTMSDAHTETISVSEDKFEFGVTRRRSSKLFANERLDTFRKSLGEEKDKLKSPKRSRRTTSTDHNDNDSEMFDQSKLPTSPLLVSRSKAQSRLNDLEKRVQRNSFVEMNKITQVRSDEEEDAIKEKKFLEKYQAADAFCEQMDWEPIEDEKITSEVYTVRLQLCEKPAEALSELSTHVMNCDYVPKETNALYVVIDTNVFLSNLPFVEEIRDSQSQQFGRPFIVVPWTVLQELDYIKDDKDNSRSQALKLNARKAVDFLNRHFSVKHPRFLGQTPSEVERNKERFMTECPDDEILQTCLQVKDATRTAVLLSYDKNLCTKAMLHDICTLGRDDPLDKMFFLKAAETRDFLSNSLHAHIEEKADDVSLIQKEMLEADDIVEESKAIMKSVLSEVISTEMRVLFKDRWEMHVLYRPPWTIVTVLKNCLKHWMAAVSESFMHRKTELMIRDLLDMINNAPEGGRKLADAEQFLSKCYDIVQDLHSAKYPEIKQTALEGIEELDQRCKSVLEELRSERMKLFVGVVTDPEEKETRAFNAFKVLEELYNLSRDICGIASDAFGLQCAIQYNKGHSFLTPKIAIDHQKDVGVNVNKLAQALEASLARINNLDNRTVRNLYEIIKNFASDWNFAELENLTPLDILCCLQCRQVAIQKGIDQLQELCVHFVRIANHQCTS